MPQVTFFGRRHLNPFVMGVSVALLAILMMLGFSGTYDDAVWYIMAGAMFFYSAFSTIGGAFWKGRFLHYLAMSAVGFAGLWFLLWLTARSLSVTDYNRPYELRLLLSAILIFYVVMSILSLLYREIVRFLSRTD